MTRARMNIPPDQQPLQRVVGHRQIRPMGRPRSPDAALQALLIELSQTRTRTPKGIFRYQTHEEANREQEPLPSGEVPACDAVGDWCGDPADVAGHRGMAVLCGTSRHWCCRACAHAVDVLQEASVKSVTALAGVAKELCLDLLALHSTG